MNTSKHFSIDWFHPGMKHLDSWKLNMMDGKQDLLFSCSQNHVLWQPFDIHRGFYNWCSVAMTHEECEITCRWLLRKRHDIILQPDFIRSINSLSVNEQHKLVVFLKMRDWDNIRIAEVAHTSPSNIKQILSRCAREYGYDSTPALINALKMKLYNTGF